MNALEVIQGDIVGYLEASPLLSAVPIYALNPRDATEIVLLQDKINKALAGLSTRNGTFGAAIIVGLPGAEVESPNAPGPEMQIVCSVRVIEQPAKNMATGGTLETAESLAINILRLLHHWHPGGGAVLTADKNAIQPADEGEGKIAYDVTVARSTSSTPVRRAASPLIANAAGTITLTASGSTSIYYTTDGTFPDAVSNLYISPFTPDAEALVRAIAYRTGFEASNISELQL